jgi:hypothetical protein
MNCFHLQFLTIPSSKIYFFHFFLILINIIIMHKPIDNWDMPLNYSKAKYKKKIPKASIIKHSIPSSNFNHIF